MDEQTRRYREAEMLAVCPFPLDFEEDTFKVQIKSADGRSTKWININGTEFSVLERMLINGFGT